MDTAKRQFVHGLWAGVAANWSERADFLDVRAGELTKTLLDGASIASTDRVLALADGPGGLGLAAAGLAAEVVSSDVVASYAEVVAARATAAGITNLTSKTLDLEDIAEPDASFDAVVIREGLMFAVDPSAAFGEIRRVLRADGRLAAATWGPKADNPWLSIVMTSVGNQVGHEVPPPGMPGPFALSDEVELGLLARAAGFTDVHVERVGVRFHAPSFDEWWDHTTALAGPVAGLVATMADDAKSELIDRVREASRAYETTDGLDFPGLSWLLTARR